MSGAVTALIWGGLVRIFLAHHLTWSINSVCHMVGKRPFRTTDQSRNVAALSVLSMGESWHNAHHVFPTLARHGVDRRQIDLTAACIRVWERLGLVHERALARRDEARPPAHPVAAAERRVMRTRSVTVARRPGR